MDGYAASVEAANSTSRAPQPSASSTALSPRLRWPRRPCRNIVFETGDEMKTDLETYFKVLYAADPASVGGTLPADDFYYAG